MKFRRCFFLVFLIFLLFFSPVFSQVNFVYATDDIVFNAIHGVQRYSGYQFALFGPSNGSYLTNNMFSPVRGSDLKNYDSFTVHIKNPSTSVSLNKIIIQFISADTVPSFTMPTGSNRTFVTFNHTLEFTTGYIYGDASGNISVNLSDYMTNSIDDDKYYFIITSVKECDTVRFSRSVPDPTPTPIPTAVPTSRPSPSPSSGRFRAILGQYFVDAGEQASLDQSFKVFPYHVEVNDSSDGKNYILHYRMSLPARFYYYDHSGTAYSYPILKETVTISPYFTNIPYDFSISRAYIDDDVSYDAFNHLKSVTSPLGNGFVLSGDFGYALYNVPVIDEMSTYSYDLCLEWSIVVNKFDTDLVFTTPSEYECTVTLNTLNYQDEINHVSDQLDSDALGQIKDNTDAIKDEQKNQNEIDNQHYQDEQDKIAEAEGNITDGANQLTGTLSSWEIFTMPFKIVQDFAGAIASDGNTGLTFPSFTLMGYQLWPSYTFDLQVIADKFPALYNALHLITGIMVVSWFIHYCWRKWHILIGDDMPEDT